MTQDDTRQEEVSESQIAVHWREEETIRPGTAFIAQANMADPDAPERFGLDNFPECFREYADLLTWDRYWHTTLDTSNPPFWKWFVGGRLNVSYNCVDRHLDEYRNKAALVWVSEREDEVDQVIEAAFAVRSRPVVVHCLTSRLQMSAWRRHDGAALP